MTNTLEQYNDVAANLGVVVHGLSADGVKHNTDVMVTGTCLLIDLENNIRCKAERLPIEITGRVTEHWGVRTVDGSVEVFVLRAEDIHAIDASTTPQKKVASMLSLLVEKEANLIIMHDKLLRLGCLCGAFAGSRIFGEKIAFVQPKPLDEYDPYAASVVEAKLFADDVIGLLAAMRELAARMNGIGPEQVEPEWTKEPEEPERTGGDNNPEQEQPEEYAEEAGGFGNNDGYDAGMLSQAEIEQLLNGMAGDEPNPDGGNGGSEEGSEGTGDGKPEPEAKPVGGKKHFGRS